MDNIVVGIDIGGSHLTAAITDLANGSIVPASLHRGSVNSFGTAKTIISEWSGIIAKTLNEYPGASVKIGIAMPGPFQYAEGISEIQNQNKYDALYGLNVKKLLAEALEVPATNIAFVNDAECFLKGEVFCGAVKEYKRAMGLTLGTGLGTAWHREGETKDAALWNHPFNGGIAEDSLATRWFITRYVELTGRTVSDVRELAGRANIDHCARQVFNEFGENLSSFLKLVTAQFMPEAVVIGGNIAKAFDLFRPALQESLQRNNLPLHIHVAKLGEEAALIGAASVWNGRVTQL